jgi:hypothetical protein
MEDIFTAGHLTGPLIDQWEREVNLADILDFNYSVGAEPERIDMFEGEFY